MASEIELVEQWASRWCWAACAEMIVRAVTGADVDQHAIALPVLMRYERNLDRPDAADLDISVTDDDLGEILLEWGVRHTFVERALTRVELDAALSDGLPVMTGILRPRGTAHLVIVTGSPSAERYRVLDPKLGVREVTYKRLVSDPRYGTWHSTWWGFVASAAF